MPHARLNSPATVRVYLHFLESFQDGGGRFKRFADFVEQRCGGAVFEQTERSFLQSVQQTRLDSR